MNLTNITLWGVVDKDSWLQTFNSVGGAADGVQRQCPLLFDDYYQVKPAFWAFADDARLAAGEDTAEEPAEAAEPVGEDVVEPSSEESSVESAQESAQEPESQPTEESDGTEQPNAPQKKSAGKILYGIGAVCAVLAAGIAGIVLVRRRKKDGQ